MGGYVNKDIQEIGINTLDELNSKLCTGEMLEYFDKQSGREMLEYFDKQKKISKDNFLKNLKETNNNIIDLLVEVFLTLATEYVRKKRRS